MKLSKQIPVVLPLYPRTRKPLREGMILEAVQDSMHLIEPAGALDMRAVEKNAKMITIDSVGIQKEAFFFQVPCPVLREETEWTELIEVGFNKLPLPGDGSRIFGETLEHLTFDFAQNDHFKLYGDGKAGQKIVAILLQRNL